MASNIIAAVSYPEKLDDSEIVCITPVPTKNKWFRRVAVVVWFLAEVLGFKVNSTCCGPRSEQFERAMIIKEIKTKRGERTLVVRSVEKRGRLEWIRRWS